MKALQTPVALRATWTATRVAAAFSETLAGLGAARLWFTPWPVPVSDRALQKQAGWLEGAERLSFTTRDGHRLSGFAAGDGPVVLLVHGWGEWAANLGAFIGPLTHAGYRVAGFDLPAHGDSSGVVTDALVNAAGIRDAADYLGGVDAVVGHSMGAHGVTLALHQGLEVKAVALLAPAVRLYGVDRFGQMFKLPERAVRGLQATIERRYGRSVWDDLAADRLAVDLDVPALIVHDADDDQISASDRRSLSEAWKGSRMVMTEGLGHGRIVRDEEVISLVVGFLGEHADLSHPSPALAESS